MKLLSVLLCFLFGQHSPDKNGICVHCGLRVRGD